MSDCYRFLKDCPRTSRSPCTTSAPGAAEAHSCRPGTTVPAQSASSAATAASSSPRTNSSSIPIGWARRTSTCSRTRRISIPGGVTWNCPASRRTRWSTRGRTSKRCSMAVLESDYLIIRHQGSRAVPRSNRDHPLRARCPPSSRPPRTRGCLRFRNCLSRCPGASSWTTCGSTTSRPSASRFHPTPCRGWPRELYYSPVSSPSLFTATPSSYFPGFLVSIQGAQSALRSRAGRRQSAWLIRNGWAFVSWAPEICFLCSDESAPRELKILYLR